MSRLSFVDLSHTIEDGLVTYKGLPAPVICDYLSREESREIYVPGTEFHIARIEINACHHCGKTNVDPGDLLPALPVTATGLIAMFK